MKRVQLCCKFFFFNDTATTEIYTLSLHDALPISQNTMTDMGLLFPSRMSIAKSDKFLKSTPPQTNDVYLKDVEVDRKSTRLNSSHANISYAVFCLKKKNYHPITAHTITDHTAILY